MNNKYISSSAADTEAIGRAVAEKLDNMGAKRAFIALFGEMGVGKTAFTRGFASHFGINTVKSPTYTVMNEYRGRCIIRHFDFYRITDGDDLYSIGYDDIIEEDGFAIGEWSENIIDFLPEDRIEITISRLSNEENTADMREITIKSDKEIRK